MATVCAVETSRGYREVDSAIDTAVAQGKPREVPHIQVLLRGELDDGDLNSPEADQLLQKLEPLRRHYEDMLSDRLAHAKPLRPDEQIGAEAGHHYREGNHVPESCRFMQLPVTEHHSVGCLKTSMHGAYRECLNKNCPARQAYLQGTGKTDEVPCAEEAA